jgi:hypothetical protein
MTLQEIYNKVAIPEGIMMEGEPLHRAEPPTCLTAVLIKRSEDTG